MPVSCSGYLNRASRRSGCLMNRAAPRPRPTTATPRPELRSIDLERRTGVSPYERSNPYGVKVYARRGRRRPEKGTIFTECTGGLGNRPVDDKPVLCASSPVIGWMAAGSQGSGLSLSKSSVDLDGVHSQTLLACAPCDGHKMTGCGPQR